ncbi:unnamed protein product [Gongylonema pulchrum]|uniref:Uncharacterized protein n=1 Tax=Gongylonema pulchrum TaxID=637853 RepID=A0A183EQ76_9BILA|nr:unnamed protein product [Gongylonema pulchrum]
MTLYCSTCFRWFRHRSRDPKTHQCRVFQFSNTGQYFCYCDTVRTVLVDCSTGKEIFNVALPRTQQIVFSPRDRLLATCEPYVVYVAPKPVRFFLFFSFLFKTLTIIFLLCLFIFFLFFYKG